MDEARAAESGELATERRKKIAGDRKRFQRARLQLSHSIILDAEGSIVDMSPSALRMLEHSDVASLEPCFFSHVHRKSIVTVMRDVADMVCRGKTKASWLLMMRTGRQRWKWFKANVVIARMEEPRIQIILRPIGN